MTGDAVLLELASDGRGWLRQGRPWRPERPFYAVVGDPVAHSLSPTMQTAALRAADLPYDYHAVRIDRDGLPWLREVGKDLGLAGFNVTAPHKNAAVGLCAELSAEARRVGAVNTVRIEAGDWIGHATDPGGILETLHEGLADRRPETGILLGAGGVVGSALAALVEVGVERRVVLARPGPGREALEAWRLQAEVEDVEVRAWSCGEPWPLDPSGAVCIAALPRGVVPPSCPQPGPDLWLDLNYGPGAAFPEGVRSDRRLDGLSVLLAQGALSFAWWFDRPAPRAAMSAALSTV